VLVYVGDLAPVFTAAARALARGGLFAFSLEATEGDGFRLGAAMRFAHSRAHFEASAAIAGLRALDLVAASTRREEARDVPGWVGVFAAA
jgi:predicted TPR repeat methyltransferase